MTTNPNTVVDRAPNRAASSTPPRPRPASNTAAVSATAVAAVPTRRSTAKQRLSVAPPDPEASLLATLRWLDEPGASDLRITAERRPIAAPAISSLIRDGRHHQIPSVMMAGVGLGMQTTDQALAELVLDGVVESEAAVQVAHDHSALTSMVRHAPPSWGPEAPASADLPWIA